MTDDGVVAEDTCLAGPLEEIVEYVGKQANSAVTVAIDAPTVRELHRDQAIRPPHAAPYPGTLKGGYFVMPRREGAVAEPRLLP
jgi:hypothetical protein